VRELPIRQWLAVAGSSDALLLDRCSGPTLDVGCGPGRLTLSLAQRGLPVLGLDISTEAVRIARRRGAAARVGDVFGDVPGAGAWRHLLLADGNIGIGGSPVTLLRRARELICSSGSVVVDAEPPGCGIRHGRLLVQAHGRQGWVRWAHVGVDAMAVVAARAGLAVSSVADDGAQRFVVELRRG
jgi:SAM-dependent methyltransferase